MIVHLPRSDNRLWPLCSSIVICLLSDVILITIGRAGCIHVVDLVLRTAVVGSRMLVSGLTLREEREEKSALEVITHPSISKQR